MVRRKTDELPRRLLRVKKRFTAWRRTRVRGERIPSRLWDAAAKAAAEFGVCQTAKVLTLDYYALQRRLSEQVEAPAMPSFLELSTSTLGASGECTIELEDGAGASMRMQIKGVDLSTIASVGQSLWTAK